MAKYFRIDVTAAVAPEVKFSAVYAERNSTAVTEDNGRNFSATRAGSACVFYNDHDVLY
jgi:hypothetical protein